MERDDDVWSYGRRERFWLFVLVSFVSGLLCGVALAGIVALWLAKWSMEGA